MNWELFLISLAVKRTAGEENVTGGLVLDDLSEGRQKNEWAINDLG